MQLTQALRRARLAILSIALTYAISLMTGMVMVHTGNAFAIDYRDQLVGRGQSSPAVVALSQNDRLRAAGLDFAGNLYAGAADTLGGLAIVVPYPLVAYRGWVGGIVSINSAARQPAGRPRRSRLLSDHPAPAIDPLFAGRRRRREHRPGHVQAQALLRRPKVGWGYRLRPSGMSRASTSWSFPFSSSPHSGSSSPARIPARPRPCPAPPLAPLAPAAPPAPSAGTGGPWCRWSPGGRPAPRGHP